MKLACLQTSWLHVNIRWEVPIDYTSAKLQCYNKNMAMLSARNLTKSCNFLEKTMIYYQTSSQWTMKWENINFFFKLSRFPLLFFLFFFFLLFCMLESHNGFVYWRHKLQPHTSFYCDLCLQEACMPTWRLGLRQNFWENLTFGFWFPHSLTYQSN